MKISIITLASAFIASSIFLSCSSADNYDKEIDVACKQSEDIEPSCTGEGKKLIRILDMRLFPSELEGLESSYIEGKYTLNGVEMSGEEYFAYMEDYQKRRNEEVEEYKSKNLVVIPCVVSSNSGGWTALLTDEEIGELQKKYNGQHDGLVFADDQDLLSSSSRVVTIPGSTSGEAKNCHKRI
jgi:hypothetical protein